jgi:acyl carrier protein
LGDPATIDVLQSAVVFVLEVDDRQVHPSSTLDELGVDSLTASQILIEIEIRLGREVPFELIETLDELSTLTDLAAAIDGDQLAATATAGERG